jgi:sialate O-acetylesterase
MLLQQNTDVKFWGWSNPRTTINIIAEWSKDTIKVSSGGKATWETTLRTPKSGGPYTIKLFTKEESITINDVMIGELWLCSGQSNMEYSVNHGVLDAKEVMPNSENNEIRFFFVPKTTSDYPQDDSKGYWKVCSPESMQKFSSVGYFFGKKLHENLQVPIGLIGSNWGGTPVETWTPKEKIINNKDWVESNQLLKESDGWDRTIASTYNGMIAPLTNMKIAGVIWYQGESNTPNAYFYSDLFTTMIQSWREKFETNLPFYYVQIAPYLRYPVPFSAAIVREQQEKIQVLENTGMVVITDLVDNLNDIHPKYKKEVGERLANYALAETYGTKTHKHIFTTLKEQKIESNKIRVYFNNINSGLIIKGKSIEGLEIAGEDAVFYLATGKIDSKTNTLLIYSKEVKKPLYVRYQFGNGIVGNLFDKDGLPVAPFRTDQITYDLEPKK